MRPSFRNKSRRHQNQKPIAINAKLLKSWPLPALKEDGDKELRGRVLVIAGSEGLPGAAILSATSALRAGAGKLQIAAPKNVAPWIAMAVPEALVIALPESARGLSVASSAQKLRTLVSRADSILIGPGMKNPKVLQRLVQNLLPNLRDKILILDAEALECAQKFVKDFQRYQVQVVITPHAGEMANLLEVEKEDVQNTPSEQALDFARTAGVIATLKGSKTYIADPDGKLYCNTAGNVGLGVSGSGDTLSGIIAGLAARGASAVQAAVWGVHLHACAGDVLAKRFGPVGYLPREIPIEIPALLKKFS